jgi:2-aminoethylphosphonate-pyruvate transaminase
MKQYVLMNPGPCNVTDRVRSALSTVDLCHREPEYFECQNDVRQLLLDVFGLDAAEYAPILLTGSGTAAMEATIASAIGPGEKVLVINNGVYGDRLAKMARAHQIDTVELVLEWTERPDSAKISAALDADPSIRTLAIVHHETTTGLLNSLEEVATVAQERGVDLIVDTISGLAGEAFDFDRIQPAYTIGTANKCIQGLPGISFVIARRRAIERAAGFPPRTIYLNLPSYLATQEQSNTPFTPAVQVVFAFREALRELSEETVAGRINRMRNASAILREGFVNLGLELLLPEEQRSNTITMIRLPEGLDYPTLHDAVKEMGFIIYAGQGDLSKTCFRVANMGAIPTDELHRFIEVLGSVLQNRKD